MRLSHLDSILSLVFYVAFVSLVLCIMAVANG